MKEKIKLLKEKLDKAKIDYRENIAEDIDGVSEIRFEIPEGRGKRQCRFFYIEEILDEALRLDFEKFRFLNGFEAVWSKELKIIEAEVTSNEFSIRVSFNRLYRLIHKAERAEDYEVDDRALKLPGIDNLEITLGSSSPEFALLSGLGEGSYLRIRNLRRITIKISNVNIEHHDATKEVLEKIANSIFFQIDLNYEISINLRNQRESSIVRWNKRNRKRMSLDNSVKIKEPKYEYDSEPISLYWYAKESINMPIFQYLAFYQSIEFYFPIFSSFEAKQKIQNIIKDPRFNPNKDSDISKIISTVKVSSSGKAYGSEREQLRSTLTAITNNIELLDFFKSDESRFNFYADNKSKSIAKQKISVKNETSDFLVEVSERIYEIRCRIVHSKASEGNFEVLLPYSNEVKELNYDIELIEFLSRKALITSSRPLRI